MPPADIASEIPLCRSQRFDRGHGAQMPVKTLGEPRRAFVVDPPERRYDRPGPGEEKRLCQRREVLVPFDS
jgi:hypothetical protein